MLSDGVMRARARRASITGRRKTLLPGKMVTSFVMGSRELYEWAHDNPAVEMRPSRLHQRPVRSSRGTTGWSRSTRRSRSTSPARSRPTRSTGKFFSGIGGQVDFIRGAARSRGGKPIIALPSTAKEGTVSRIQAVLEEGAGVVTSRGDVHYVVTEYGVADLWGKSIRERALALIAIAHPDFRARAARRRPSSGTTSVPGSGRARARTTRGRRSARSRLPDGAPILIRPVRITDEQPLQALFYRSRDESIYRRFLGFKQVTPARGDAEARRPRLRAGTWRSSRRDGRDGTSSG